MHRMRRCVSCLGLNWHGPHFSGTEIMFLCAVFVSGSVRCRHGLVCVCVCVCAGVCGVCVCVYMCVMCTYMCVCVCVCGVCVYECVCALCVLVFVPWGGGGGGGGGGVHMCAGVCLCLCRVCVWECVCICVCWCLCHSCVCLCVCWCVCVCAVCVCVMCVYYVCLKFVFCVWFLRTAGYVFQVKNLSVLLQFCVVHGMGEVCVSCGSLELLGMVFKYFFIYLYVLFTGIACRAPPEWNCPEEEAYDEGVPWWFWWCKLFPPQLLHTRKSFASVYIVISISPCWLTDHLCHFTFFLSLLCFQSVSFQLRLWGWCPLCGSFCISSSTWPVLSVAVAWSRSKWKL